MQKLLLPVVVAAVLIALHAIPQGFMSRRWGSGDVSEEQKAFAARLANVPTSFGDWESDGVPIGERELAASGSVGSYSRRFHNRNDPGKVVQVFLVCGSSYDVTMHTPDQCYVLSGFSEAESQDRHVVDTGKTAADFSTNRFRRTSTVDGPQHLRIFWSFSGDGKWEAPTTPKLELMSAPALYKIYAITEVAGDNATRAADSPAVPFLREFIPILTATLFPSDKNATAASAPSPDAVPGVNAPDSAAKPAADLPLVSPETGTPAGK